MSFIAVIKLLFLIEAVRAAFYSYNYSDPVNGPSGWQPTECQLGAHQSPINLQSPFTDVSLPALIFTNFQHDFHNWSLVNNGHSLQINVPTGLASVPTVSGGELSQPYILQQFHFHWSQTNNNGSEHAVNGKHSPLEMHLVFGAQSNSSIVAVLAVLFDIGFDGGALSDIFAEVSTVKGFNSTDTLKHVDLRRKIPFGAQNFWRYDGSLTTPPCSENVTWTIFVNKLIVTQQQLDILRKTKNWFNSQEVNERPDQPLNNRVVYLNRPSLLTTSTLAGGPMDHCGDCDLSLCRLSSVLCDICSIVMLC